MITGSPHSCTNTISSILENSNFHRDRRCTQSFSFWSNFHPNLTSEMAEIKNTQLAIQIIQNQSPISLLLSMKTVINFCSIWASFRYNWVMGPGSKINRSQFRLAALFQKPFIVSDFQPIFKCNSIGFPDAELYAKNFENISLKKPQVFYNPGHDILAFLK